MLTQYVDHAGLAFVRRAFATSGRLRGFDDDPAARLVAAAEFYERLGKGAYFAAPGPIAVEEQQRGTLEGGGAIVDVAFESPFVPFAPCVRSDYLAHCANRTARARHYRHARPAPTILAVHGWYGGVHSLELAVLPLRALYRMGFDVVLAVLPFHASRSGSRVLPPLFPTFDPFMTNEGIAQALCDLRVLSRACLARGAPEVGYVGTSLGSYLVTLLGSHDPSASFAVAVAPVFALGSVMWRHGNGTRERRRAERLGVVAELVDRAFAIHDPGSTPAVIAEERRFIVAGRLDRVAPPDQAQRLAQHWNRAPIWYRGGHVLATGRASALRRLFADHRRQAALAS